MTLTEEAAWYGAVVSTVVLAWDVFKWWRGGARFLVNVYPNMVEMSGASVVYPHLAGRRLVRVEVLNVGSKKTTMTNLAGRVYSSQLERLRGRRAHSFVVTDPSVSHQLPAGIDPGERWAGNFEQTDDLARWGRDAILLIEVHHTMAPRPILRRLRIPRAAAVRYDKPT